MTPAIVGSSRRRRIDAVPRRRPRSRDRRSLPPHPRDRRAARSGGDRLRLGRARRAGLGEGAAPRLAGHARPRHSRPRSRARAARCSACATGSKPTSPPATSAGCCSPATSASRSTRASPRARPRALLARAEAGWGRATYGLALGRLRQELRGARRRSRCVGRRPRGRAGRRRSRRRAFAPGSPRSSPRFPRPRADGTGAAAGRRRARVSAFLEHSHGAQAARSTIAPQRRSQEYVGELRALGRSRARCPRRCASSASACSRSRSRPSVRAPVTSTRARLSQCRLRRPPAPLRRRPRRRPRVPVATEDAGAARRRARGDLAGLAAARPTGSTKRCTPCCARLAVVWRRTRHLQLFVPRHARVPRDLRVVADAAGVPAAAGRTRRCRIRR